MMSRWGKLSLCLLLLIANLMRQARTYYVSSEKDGRGSSSPKKVTCEHNGTIFEAGYYGVQKDPCEFWWCLSNGTMDVTKCRVELPRHSGYGGCWDVSIGGYFPRCCRYERVC
uniref:Putative 9.4 kDa secreted protein n=1 Tax=Rhipicephalus sanguineus TaxID=34632 RepID=C9W1L4_RHISA